MNALILAGGLGTRLRKPGVEAGGIFTLFLYVDIWKEKREFLKVSDDIIYLLGLSFYSYNFSFFYYHLSL